MAIFQWLENTPLAIWVGESMLGYPLMLSLHAIGLAMVVGVFSVLGLRLLGLFVTLPLSALLAPIRIAWLGCLVSGLSGVALFSSQALVYASSTPFLIKVASLACGGLAGGVIHWHLHRAVLTAAASGQGGPQTKLRLRLLGLMSLASSTAAIFAGRLIAYL